MKTKSKKMKTKINTTVFLLISFFILFSNLVFCQNLVVFNNIPDRSSSDKFSVKIKLEGYSTNSEWINSLVGKTKSDNQNGGGYFNELQNWTASWSSFEFDIQKDKSVLIEISKLYGDDKKIKKIQVRPALAVVKSWIDPINGKAYVRVNKHINFNVDIDGQMEEKLAGPIHTISIFANPIYKIPNDTSKRIVYLNPGDKIPDYSSWDILYFKPGVHRVHVKNSNGEVIQKLQHLITFTSNKQIYIPGDAMVHGRFVSDFKYYDLPTNFSVYGSGIISGEEITREPGSGDDENGDKKVFQGPSGGNFRLEGFVVIDPAYHTFVIQNFNYEKVDVYKNIKILGWRANSDGINAFHNADISDCFFRVQDDAFYYGFSNVKIRNTTTWHDANGSVLAASLSNNETLDSSIFENINIIYHRNHWPYYGNVGMMWFNVSPYNGIKNIHIKNVIVEDPLPTYPPFSFSSTDIPNGIDSNSNEEKFSNIIIENFRMDNRPIIGNWGGYYPPEADYRNFRTNKIIGYSDAYKIKNITFKNSFYNGKKMTNFETAEIITNEFVEKNSIKFIFDCNLNLSTNKVLLRHNISPRPGNHTYQNGEEITLTARPTIGYRFNGWTDQNNKLISLNKSYKFVIDSDLNLKANFAFRLFNIFYNSKSDGGTNSLDINIDWENQSPGTLRVIDSAGKVVVNEIIYLKEGLNNFSFKSFNLSAGVYFVSILDGTTKETTKFIVK